MPAFPPIQKMITESDVAWSAYCIERDLKPLPEQFALAPGDKAIAMAGEALIDRQVALIEIEDPEAYVEQYPDHEARTLNSYVLTRYWNPKETPQLGWYARCRLIPITAEEYEQVSPYFTGETEAGREPPEWLRERWQEMMDRQSEAEPVLVPKHVTCPSCHKRDVALHLEMTTSASVHAGEVKQGSKTIYSAVARPEWETTIEVHLHCLDCGAQAQLDPDELDPEIKFPSLI